jgi:hypothetical protein
MRHHNYGGEGDERAGSGKFQEVAKGSNRKERRGHIQQKRA